MRSTYEYRTVMLFSKALAQLTLSVPALGNGFLHAVRNKAWSHNVGPWQGLNYSTRAWLWEAKSCAHDEMEAPRGLAEEGA